MKWSKSLRTLRNRSLVASLAILTYFPFLGGVDQAQAKPPSKVQAKKSISLDDIQLDETPVKPRPKTLAVPTPGESQVEIVPDAIKLILAVADRHEKEKDFASVVSTLKPKIDQLPRKGLLQLARASVEIKDSLTEIHALELTTAKNPKDYVAECLLGDAYMRVKRYDDAANAYGASRDQNPRYRPAFEGALSILEATQETAEARILVQDIIKVFGADAKNTASLCQMFSGDGFIPERSEAACRTAIAKDPKNPENFVYLTQALQLTDQKDNADKTVADAAKRFPASEVVQTLAGDMKIADKSYAESYRYFLQASKANPNSAKAQLGLAKSAFELQKYDESIDAFTKSCKLDRRLSLDFRQAATTLKKNKDDKWLKFQDAADERCN
jgi:tetratricopeptide (TPR) repeat protein